MLIVALYIISLQHLYQADVEADKKNYHLVDDDL